MGYVDLHVHIDFYSNPTELANEYENLKIYTIFVTYLPEIFLKTRHEYENYKYVRMALGFHPDMVGEYSFDKSEFEKSLKYTRYIGEVGLDFSGSNQQFKNEQLDIFNQITSPKYNKGNVYSIHSRKAESEVLEILKRNNVKNAIFHWYTGGKKTLKDIASSGYFFSVNHKMLTSKNGREIIQSIPKSQLLFETDGPFARKDKKIVYPKDLKEIYWDFEKVIPDFEKIVFSNFKRLLFQKDIDKLN
ncbi:MULTISPECIES: TatD family hydrolase [Enterococcus]|uniref:TatD family hydrolase n=1 Tax=Enterococcus TaxID=1350 RepID=UPI0021CAA037|nr:TatD family hydrolase [Enterococcus faecalis]